MRVILLLFLLTAAACSGKVTGTVFLDSNGNGYMEPEELRFANVVVKVYDGHNALVGQVKTDMKGAYQVATNGPEQYCVLIDEASLQLVGTSTGIPTKHAAGVQKELAAGTTGTPATSSQTGNTTPTTGSGTATPGTTTPGTTSTGTATGTTTTQPARPAPPPTGALCAEDGNTLNVEINLAVERDYKAAISRFPAPSKTTYHTGEAVTVSIVAPEECRIQSLVLPDDLALALTTKPQAIQFNPDLNEVTFPSPPAAHAKLATPTVLDTAAMAVTALALRVRDDIPSGERNITIAPQAVCPGNATIDLQPIEMTVKAIPTLLVSLHLQTTPTLGGKLPLVAQIQNTSSAAYDDAKLLVAATAFGLQVVQVDAGCSNLGTKAECYLDIAGKSKTERKVVVQLPSKLESSPTQFTIDAKVTIPDAEDPIGAEPAVFWLEE